MATDHLDPTIVDARKDGDEERTLVLAAQGGDHGAFRELYEAHRDRTYNLVVYSIGDVLQAEDVVQTVFLKVFRGLRSFRFQSNLSTWIYRIAYNECRDYHRRRGTPHVPLEAILGGSDEVDLKPDSLDQHARRERESIVQQAVMQLSPPMRAVVALKYVEGLSYEEMSKILGCAPGTVASRLNRALVELEERLRPFRRFL